MKQIPAEFALIPATIAEATNPNRRVVHNTQQITPGEELFLMEFDYIHYDEDGLRTPTKMTTEFLAQGSHCIITLPGSFTPTCTNKHLQDYIDNLYKLGRRFNKLVIIAKDSADDIYEWVMSAVRKAPWYNAKIHGKPDILQKLGIVCISDPTAKYINALGFAADGGRLTVTSKRGLVVANNGIALEVKAEDEAKFCDRVKVSAAEKSLVGFAAAAQHPAKKLTIVGGGIAGAMKAYFAHLEAKKNNQLLRVTVYEKNPKGSDTTTSKIVPSLTHEEMAAVVPPPHVLRAKLGILFSEPGGIRVDDVPNVNDSVVTENFLQKVQFASADEAVNADRLETLLAMGKASMDMWQRIYDEADPEFREIMEASNYNPCRESKRAKSSLHEGYRIDLINVPNAQATAEGMKQGYVNIGYVGSRILSPAEVIELDPFLADFCAANSELQDSGERTWRNDAVALYRPGGCIDAETFLPKLYGYLVKAMGKYTNHAGVEKDCFRLKFSKSVNGLVIKENVDGTLTINGLNINQSLKINKHEYAESKYTICPGENVGTLNDLGLDEPAYAGFAGASLRLNIPVPADKVAEYSKFNHCMEVHREGVVLAWQARFREGKIFIGVAGTKAYYGDVKPNKDEAFATNRNLLQLNMINYVLPEFISLALGRNTVGVELTAEDMTQLEQAGIAERWVGIRAVAADGFATLGKVYKQGRVVENGECITHLGSGGASFAPAAVFFSQAALTRGSEKLADLLAEKISQFGSSRRFAAKL